MLNNSQKRLIQEYVRELYEEKFYGGPITPITIQALQNDINIRLELYYKAGYIEKITCWVEQDPSDPTTLNIKFYDGQGRLVEI